MKCATLETKCAVKVQVFTSSCFQDQHVEAVARIDVNKRSFNMFDEIFSKVADFFFISYRLHNIYFK